MKNFYRDKYLIAVYDKDDYLINIASSPSEIFSNISESSARSYLNKVFKGKIKNENIYFIDVFEKHNDIFAEEDNIFLRQYNLKETNAEKAKKLGVSLRTYNRYKSKGKLDILFKRENLTLWENENTL